MRTMFARLGVATAALGALWATSVGCGLSADPNFSLIGPLFLSSGQTPVGGGGTGTDGSGGFFDDDSGRVVDACGESTDRKFVSITMRNASNSFIHYFVALIAFEQGETYADGAVCPDDRQLYTDFGYVFIPEGSTRAFGNYCIAGPAYLYFHFDGQFRTSAAAASSIPPAQGTALAPDAFFASGRRVPVPNLILFHNPGSGAGRALKVATSNPDPCNAVLVVGDADCDQDAFYYVDQNDRTVGSTTLGRGSAVRTPSDIQGSGCECTGQANVLTNAAQQLATGSQTGANVSCNEFLRGGTIDYVFLKDDSDPLPPQLVWNVTDATGHIAHSFDERAQLP